MDMNTDEWKDNNFSDLLTGLKLYDLMIDRSKESIDMHKITKSFTSS